MKDTVENSPEELDDASFKQAFGTLYTNVETKRTRNASVYEYLTIFCVKRMIYAYVTIFYSDTLFVIIIAYICLPIASINFFVNCKPLKGKALNYIEIMNEMFILQVSYYMFVFTDFVQSVPLRYDIGFVFMYYASFTLVVNFVIIAYEVY